MQPIARPRNPLPLAAAVALTMLLAPAAPITAGASKPGTSAADPVPSHCTPQPLGDVRCAGVLLRAGDTTIWAGQWLFTDASGHHRIGTCTYHLGTHPTAEVPAHQVQQALPNDPSGGRSAYLAWKYGNTADNLTAAAMWVVMHYYAQDTAGAGPLFPSLDMVAGAIGRADVQQRAIELAAEAEQFATPWTLTLALAPDGTATITLRSGTTPVAGRPISVLVSGSDLPLAATTGADGATTVAVTIPPSGTVTVVASTPVPAPAAVYAGQPVTADPDGPQTLLTGGGEGSVQATAQLVPPPAPAPAPTTTTPGTTTTVLATSTVQQDPALPNTGRGDGGIAQLATALLVGGIGLMGTLRRREAPLAAVKHPSQDVA